MVTGPTCAKTVMQFSSQNRRPLLHFRSISEFLSVFVVRCLLFPCSISSLLTSFQQFFLSFLLSYFSQESLPFVIFFSLLFFVFLPLCLHSFHPSSLTLFFSFHIFSLLALLIINHRLVLFISPLFSLFSFILSFLSYFFSSLLLRVNEISCQ